jgi:phosphatidylglycerol:prolipoprotein diacylglycerol transferase
MNTIISALPYWQFGPWTPIDALPWLKIHAFGTAVAIGVIIAMILGGGRLEKRHGIRAERFQDFSLVLVFVGFIFAHVFSVLWYSPGEVLQNPLVLLEIWGGISSYGGLLGGIIGLYIWHRRHPDEDTMMWADNAAWSLPFAWLFGRIGCALVHDHPGVTAPDSWPLAFKFPDGSIRHDLGFYEAIWWVVIVMAVLVFDRKRRQKGFYLAVIPMLYAPIRFILDFLRVWPEAPEGGTYDIPAFTQFWLDLFGASPETYVYGGDTRYLGLTPAQYMSVALFGFGLWMWFRVKDNPPAGQE